MNFKTFAKYIVIVIFSLCSVLGLVYLSLGYYYKDSFSFGTRINGVYCTGRTPEEVGTLLNENYEYAGVNVINSNSTMKFFIPAEDIDFTYDFADSLSFYLNNQNEWLWPQNLFSSESKTIVPVVHINEEKLNTILDSIELLNESEAKVYTEYKDGELVIFDNIKHRPDVVKMRSAIKNAIYSSETEVQFDETYYADLEYTEEQKQIINQYLDLKTMFSSNIEYVCGEDVIPLTDFDMSNLLLRDEFGNFVRNEDVDLSEQDIGKNETKVDRDGEESAGEVIPPYKWDDEKIDEWVERLADKYDTVGITRQFHTTDGRDILVEGGTYGNKIDRKKEKEYLRDALRTAMVESHEPEYEVKAYKQGLNDIGDTYIEVDMSDQKMYYYKDGELLIDTPVVTGNMARRCDTPTGTNYVYFMQKNRTLHGANYETFVYYWIAVVGHIGIHDATWRNEFGGDIYLTDGSHGCINTPMEEVSRLYELVELGTPAIMYYDD